MGLKIVILAILAAGASYWLYSPLPPGYSSSSRMQFQVMMAVMKITEVGSRVASHLGFGNFAEINRDVLLYFMRKMIKSDANVLTRDAVFDGISVRIYEPQDALNETLPGIVYYHGGGWTYGGIDSVDELVKHLCKDTRTVIVSVEYRMAPEFPFPAAIDDCSTATKYFLKNAVDFHVDPKRIAVAGDSAGGNLAATVPLRLRDEKFPIPIKLQILIYPVVQGLDFNLPSMLQNSDGPVLTRDMMLFFTSMYIEGNEDLSDTFSENRHVVKSFREKIAKSFMNLEKLPKEFLVGYKKQDYPDGDEKVWNDISERMLDPYYSPLAAENLKNLPEAYIFTANYDPLRDEGWLYAVKLKEAGNKVTIYNGENSFHGIVSFVGLFPEADPIFKEITKFIALNL